MVNQNLDWSPGAVMPGTEPCPKSCTLRQFCLPVSGQEPYKLDFGGTHMIIIFAK